MTTVHFLNTELQLLKQKAIMLPQFKAILIADLHYGKAAHFRKSGIPIPEPIHTEDLNLIQYLLVKYRPKDFYILGDLFHSAWNEQWDRLIDFLGQYPETQFHLIMGNHDILGAKFYSSSIFKIHSEQATLGDLILTHEPMEIVPSDKLNLCGHIHPGFRLVGKGRQSLRVPCFHWRANQLILPAFGQFTGLAMMKAKANDKIYGISDKKIIPILY